MGGKDILSLTDAAQYDAYIDSLMECKLLSEEDVEDLCKKVSYLSALSFFLSPSPRKYVYKRLKLVYDFVFKTFSFFLLFFLRCAVQRDSGA